MRSVMGVFRAAGFAMPLLLPAGLPAAAFEITHLRPPPRDLPLTATALPTEQAGSLGPQLARRLELTLFDHVGLTPTTTEQIRREVEEIFVSLGTDIGWLDPGLDRPVAAVSTRIQVILIPSAPRAWVLEKGTMGVVHRREGGPAENVYIFPAAVMNTLGLFPEAREPNRLLVQNRRFARALGRVIGHEIIHAIAPDHTHAAKGLMREQLNRFWLAGSELTVDALCARAFLAHLKPWPRDLSDQPVRIVDPIR